MLAAAGLTGALGEEVVMVVVDGDVSPGYEAVREAFAENFRSGGEVGGAVSAVVDNRVVVDLWGGAANLREGRPWERDMLVNLFSTTKGLSALAVAHAHSRAVRIRRAGGHVLARVRRKRQHDVTVRTLLSHQAGLCAIDTPMTVATLADPDAVAAAIGPQKPAWRPGERHGYHAVTLGWYESELIRRTDPQHRTVGRYFAEEIAAPLGLEVDIGLPDEVPDERLARIMGDWYRVKMLFHMRSMPRRFVTNFLNPRSITARSFANPKVVGQALRDNDREIRRLELPSSNATGTARGVAAAYGEFATAGRRLGIDEVTLAALTQPATAPSGGQYDQVLHTDTVFSLGACKPWPGFEFGSPQAFGTPGAGGSMGFADPQLRMGFCYALNRMGFHLWNDPREVVLRHAAQIAARATLRRDGGIETPT
jgi:CubicO group peptidase (beta-lactamase class C family)